ncbi:MAG TPA: RNA polymerase sigma factor [Longimicrobiales bacterium]|nr:RNA polymerase sigma factor [Longimicrobiales bacterium]
MTPPLEGAAGEGDPLAAGMPMKDPAPAPVPGTAGAERAVEAELIRKCVAGQSRFYEPLVRAYEPVAQRVALGILGDADGARDAVQQAFIRAYDALDRFDPERSFRPWFLQILRNQCRDELRRRKAGFEVQRMDAVLAQRLAGDEDAARDHRRTRARELLWTALGRISVEHREVLVLKEIEGLSYGEIAETAGVPEGTVASRLFHARRALREALEEMGVEYP